MKILLLIPSEIFHQPNAIQKILFEKNKHLHNEVTFESYDLAKIGACLIQNGHDVEATDMRFYPKWLIEETIKTKNPEFIILDSSSYQQSTHLSYVISFIELLKSFNSDLKVVWSGRDPSFLYENLLIKCEFIDYVVVGEPELTIIELLQSYIFPDVKKDIKKIKGLAYRVSGVVKYNGNRELIKELDLLPFPAYELFNLKRESALILEASRGCSFNCKFCYRLWRKVRMHSIDYLIKEIKYFFEKFGITKFEFDDENFTLHNSFVEEFCGKVLDLEFKIKFSCYSRINTIKMETLILLKKAGCIELRFGIESGSQKILDKMNKQQNINEIIKVFKLIKKSGIRAYALFLVGYPGENEETINESIKLINIIQPDAVDAKIVKLFPGTELYLESVEQGYIDNEIWFTDNFDINYTKEYSMKKLNDFLYRLENRNLKL